MQYATFLRQSVLKRVKFGTVVQTVQHAISHAVRDQRAGRWGGRDLLSIAFDHLVHQLDRPIGSALCGLTGLSGTISGL